MSELADYARSDAFDEQERDCLRLADAMTATPAAVPDPLFERLSARYSEAALVELTSAIAWENYRSRSNRALGIGSDGFANGAACALPARLTESPANAPGSV